MQVKKQQLEPDMEQWTDSKLGKEHNKAVTLLIYLQCRVRHCKGWTGWITSWNQDCWEKYQHLRYADYTTLKAESEELKSLLMRVKEEREKVDLKFNIQKTKVMASSPISSWQIEGEKLGTVTNFIFVDSKITGNNYCSHENKRHLLLWKKPETISRDIILQIQFLIVKAMVFPVVMRGSQLDHKEGWTLKNCFFWIMCWRRLLESLGWQGDQISQS